MTTWLEALAKLSPEERDAAISDQVLYGTAFIEVLPDGTARRIDPMKVTQQPGGGFADLSKANRLRNMSSSSPGLRRFPHVWGNGGLGERVPQRRTAPLRPHHTWCYHLHVQCNCPTRKQ